MWKLVLYYTHLTDDTVYYGLSYLTYFPWTYKSLLAELLEQASQLHNKILGEADFHCTCHWQYYQL